MYELYSPFVLGAVPVRLAGLYTPYSTHCHALLTMDLVSMAAHITKFTFELKIGSQLASTAVIHTAHDGIIASSYTEVCRIFATAECIAFHVRNALGTVAGVTSKDITLNIAHNKLLHVKALVAWILQTSVNQLT